MQMISYHIVWPVGRRQGKYNIKVAKFETKKSAKVSQCKQEEGELVDNFLTPLYCLLEYCKYGNLHDEMMCDRIVARVSFVTETTA